jgi:putative transposase
MEYRGFPAKLHHEVPSWVQSGALFHIRIAADRDKQKRPITDPLLAPALLNSARFYEAKQRWHIKLFVLMPDHLHALVSFPSDAQMSRVIGDWKHFQVHEHASAWQEGYFDHRLRADERGTQVEAKANYIRRNPVAASLCVNADEWPWIIAG